MRDVITVQNMRESDAYTIANFVPSKELMYRAAMGVYKAVDWAKGPIGILAGAGNNGGDGYALACILADRGISSRIYRVSEKFSEDGRYYHDLAAAKGVDIRMFTEETDLTGYAILVDCMLGTGFSGQVRGLYRAAITAINYAGTYVVSVDINSGMNGDTGKAELAVKADLTVTIGYLKTGFYLGDAAQYLDRLVVTDIGIRLLREEYHLAASYEAAFPASGQVKVLTMEEAEALLAEGQTIPTLAEELARKEGTLVRVEGKYPLVSDGHRTYFLTDGEQPPILPSLGEQA